MNREGLRPPCGLVSGIAWISLTVLAAMSCAAPAPADWASIGAELATRTAHEQDLRQRLVGSGTFDHAVAMELEAADASNRAWLKEVVARHGWPLASQVGREGARQAWLLAQHADADVPFQEHCLELLRAAVAAGEGEATDLAYLEDRVAVNRGRPQLYGTQFHERDGEMVPQPILDPERVEERRAAVGLEPLADYAARIRALSQGGT